MHPHRLIGVGMTEETADAWIDAWAAQAAKDVVEPGAGYWDRLASDQRRAAATGRP